MSSVGLGSQSPTRFSFIRECFMEITLPPPTRVCPLYPETPPGTDASAVNLHGDFVSRESEPPRYRLVNKLAPCSSSNTVDFISDSGEPPPPLPTFCFPPIDLHMNLIQRWDPFDSSGARPRSASLDDRPERRDQLFPGGSSPTATELLQRSFIPRSAEFQFPISVARSSGYEIYIRTSSSLDRTKEVSGPKQTDRAHGFFCFVRRSLVEPSSSSRSPREKEPSNVSGLSIAFAF